MRFIFFRLIQKGFNLLKKLAKILRAEIVEIHQSTFEVIVRAPKGHVWIDNGQEEICDQQWEGESRRQVKENIVERMKLGLERA